MSGSIITKEGEPEAGPAARAGWTSASYPVLCNSEAAQGKQMHVMRMYSDAGIGSSHHESPRILFSTPDLLKAFTYLWPLGSKGWDVNRPDSETPDFSVPCFCIIPKKYSWFTNSGVHGTLLFNILGNKLIVTWIFHLSKQNQKEIQHQKLWKDLPLPYQTGLWVPRFHTVTGGGGRALSHLFNHHLLPRWPLSLVVQTQTWPPSHAFQTTHGPQESLCQAQLSSEVPVIWGCQIHRKKHINNKKRGHPVKFEFQVNSKLILSVSVFYAIFGTYLSKKSYLLSMNFKFNWRSCYFIWEFYCDPPASIPLWDLPTSLKHPL